MFTILYYFKKIQFDEHMKADMKYVTQQLNDLGRLKNAQMEEVMSAVYSGTIYFIIFMLLLVNLS